VDLEPEINSRNLWIVAVLILRNIRIKLFCRIKGNYCEVSKVGKSLKPSQFA